MNRIKLTILTLIIIVCFGFVGCFGPGSGDYSYNISKDYKVYSAGTTLIVKENEGEFNPETTIPSDIKLVGWNDKFICVMQKNQESHIENGIVNVIEDDTENYWIINIENDEVYGPMIKDEYNNKKIELGIEKIKLKSPDKFRYLEETK